MEAIDKLAVNYSSRCSEWLILREINEMIRNENREQKFDLWPYSPSPQQNSSELDSTFGSGSFRNISPISLIKKQASAAMRQAQPTGLSFLSLFILH